MAHIPPGKSTALALPTASAHFGAGREMAKGMGGSSVFPGKKRSKNRKPLRLCVKMNGKYASIAVCKSGEVCQIFTGGNLDLLSVQVIRNSSRRSAASGIAGIKMEKGCGGPLREKQHGKKKINK